jgi:hypothetical protein
MTELNVFLWGAAGSIAMDVVAVVKYFESTPLEFPDRYSRFWYYVARLLLASVGGGLAVAYGIDKPILALNIGAAAPLLITALSQGLGGPALRAGISESQSDATLSAKIQE